MRFTVLMWAAPVLLLLAGATVPDGPQGPDSLTLVGALWAWLNLPVLGVYWLVRVARLAWRHAAPKT